MEVKVRGIDQNGKLYWERKTVVSVQEEFDRLLLLDKEYAELTIQRYPLVNHEVHYVIKDGKKQQYKPATKYHVVSFSGGKDSTAMLLRMIELGYHIDEVIFCDTGLEFDEMYEHIDDVERYIGRPITRLSPKRDYNYFMFEHEKTRGKNKGKKGYSWMDGRVRWCTAELKYRPFYNYVYKQRGNYEVVEYHGIAVDEIERTYSNDDGRDIQYPLVDWGWSEKDALQYCYDNGFYWGGLYEKFDRLSCWLCPLQRIGELEIVHNDFPDKWQVLEELDRKNIERYGRQFRPDYSVQELTDRFNNKHHRKDEE